MVTKRHLPDSTSNREDLQRAIDRLAAEGERFGQTAVTTSIAVLKERLAALENASAPAGDPGSRIPLPAEQRKQVSILFASIDGFTHIAGASQKTARLHQIDHLWHRLDQTVRDHGGRVDKHMGDVVMGLFGLPTAREDDPERAVRCALSMKDIVLEFMAEQRDDPLAFTSTQQAPTVRVGLNTGSVISGSVGSDAGYTVIGDAVNVASRLRETATESGVYISHDTYRLVQRLFRVEELGSVKIKGRQTPVAVYRVVGLGRRYFFSGSESVEGVVVPITGRDAELDQLESIFQKTVQTTRAHLVTITGEAGVGKSRLLREFRRRLDSSPHQVVIYYARPDQRLSHVPFSFLREMVIARFGIEDNDRPIIVEEKLVSGLAREGLLDGNKVDIREQAQAIARLVGLDVTGSDGPSNYDSESASERDQTLEWLTNHFRTLTNKKAATVYFLEDINWADSDTLDWLEQLMVPYTASPVMIVCVARPSFIARRPDWPSDPDLAAHRLTLSPLPEADCRELVRRILSKVPVLDPVFVDLIVQSSGGNPYYVEELIKVLIEDGYIVAGESVWQLQLGESRHLRIPTTLTGLLQARLDRLSEGERTVLQQAAVMGDEFWDSSLLNINQSARYPLNQEQIDDALRSLEKREMIIRVPSTLFLSSRAFRFYHTVLREVAYESVLLRERAGYHGQVARWWEAQSGERMAEHAALIGQHYEWAGRFPDAARLYDIAATRAVEQVKLGIAIDYFSRALELLRDLPHYLDTRLSLQTRLGRLLHQEGRMAEALQMFQGMRYTAELDGNLLRQAQAENALADTYLELAQPDRALEAAIRADQVARLTHSDLEIARAGLSQAEAAAQLGQTERAIQITSDTIEHCRTIYIPRELSKSLALLCRLAEKSGETGMLDRPLKEFADLVDQLESQKAPEDTAFALCRLGEYYLEKGNYDEARLRLHKALAYQQSANDQVETVTTLRLMGLVSCRDDDPAGAITYLDEAASLAESTGNRHLLLVCRLAMGEALLAGRRFEAAEATLRQVIAIAEDDRRMGNWNCLPEAYHLLVDTLNRQGRQDEAAWVLKKVR
jgi:class 3 adenylate cyclase/tetratricopeptide (TPR) repeat protein